MNTQPPAHSLPNPQSDQAMTDTAAATGQSVASAHPAEAPALPSASASLAGDLLRESHRQQIIAKCEEIDKVSVAGIPVESRIALGKFLIENRINNPGGLNDHQRRLCRFSLTEHAARNKAAPPTVPAMQWKSYIHPGDEGETFQLMKNLDLHPGHFKL